ncbi:MAG: DUF4258 domain-containing protein [Anaerolineae bacterium]
MVITDIEDLIVRRRTMRLSDHALREAHKESLRAKDVLYAFFKGEVIEHYPQRHRVLVAGPLKDFDITLHVVCDYTDVEEIVAITVYIPDRPAWVNESVRGI